MDDKDRFESLSHSRCGSGDSQIFFAPNSNIDIFCYISLLCCEAMVWATDINIGLYIGQIVSELEFLFNSCAGPDRGRV